MLNAEAVAAGAQTDLDDLRIAKNAREEKLAARKKSQMTPEEIASAHGDGAALSPAGASSEQPTIQIQGLRWQQEAEVQEVTHKDVSKPQFRVPGSCSRFHSAGAGP